MTVRAVLYDKGSLNIGNSALYRALTEIATQFLRMFSSPFSEAALLKNVTVFGLNIKALICDCLVFWV